MTDNERKIIRSMAVKANKIGAAIAVAASAAMYMSPPIWNWLSVAAETAESF
jgi:hypothetical protein